MPPSWIIYPHRSVTSRWHVSIFIVANINNSYSNRCELRRLAMVWFESTFFLSELSLVHCNSSFLFLSVAPAGWHVVGAPASYWRHSKALSKRLCCINFCVSIGCADVLEEFAKSERAVRLWKREKSRNPRRRAQVLMVYFSILRTAMCAGSSSESKYAAALQNTKQYTVQYSMLQCLVRCGDERPQRGKAKIKE